MKIKTVCVIGAGTMGCGIAQVSAQAGYETVLFDTKQEALVRGIKILKKGLCTLVEKGKLKEADINNILGRLRTSMDIKDGIKDADFIIEAVPERADIKLRLFKQLEEICPKRTILTSNTSGIPISLLGSVTRRPEKVIGMHFLYPVPIMPGIEVVKSLLTSQDTLATSLKFARSIGKEPIVVKDSPGFVVNRILPLILNESAKMVEENIAGVEDIDKMMVLALGWPIGPLMLADKVGIDVAVDCLEGIYQQTGWERYKPAQLLKRMVEIGCIGQKSGKGFYDLFGKK